MGRIVIVDDDVITLEIHRQYLEEAHDVITFDDAVEALERIPEIRPDLILLDIEMPFLNGFELLEKLRVKKGCAGIPVIGVTGQRDKVTALRFISAGATSYLMKPVEKHLMRERISEILQKHYEQQSKKKVLLVDDEIESLLFYKNVLQEQFSVMTLNSSKLALEYLQKHVPDLIILDYQMPLYNGRALYQMISKMDRLENVPVVFLTGATEREVLIECAAMQPSAVVLKSTGKNGLLEKVNGIFKESR